MSGFQNGAQNDNYANFGAYQYNQSMASGMNGPQMAYGRTKTTAVPMMQQQAGLAGARQAQRNQMPGGARQVPPASQYAGRAPLGPQMSNTGVPGLNLRQGQAAGTSQYFAPNGVNRMAGGTITGLAGRGGAPQGHHLGQMGSAQAEAYLGASLGSQLHAKQHGLQQYQQHTQQARAAPAGLERGPGGARNPFEMLSTGPAAATSMAGSKNQYGVQPSIMQQQQQGAQQGQQAPLPPQTQQDAYGRFPVRTGAAERRGAGLPIRPGGAAAGGVDAGGREGVLDSSEFPALGNMAGGAHPMPGMPNGGTPQHGANMANLAALNITGQQGNTGNIGAAAATGTHKPKLDDTSEFPALGNVAGGGPGGATQQPPAHLNGGHRTRDGAGGNAQPYAAAGAFWGGATAAHAAPDMDAYLLRGLMQLVKVSDPEDRLAILGTDVQSLGFDFRSQSLVTPSLGSLWARGSIGGMPEGRAVPPAFLFEPVQLLPMHFAQMGLCALMMAFYTQAGQEQSVLAAEELLKRNWRWHRMEQQWMLPKQVKPVSHQNSPGQEGVFDWFDVDTWSVKTREGFHFETKHIEAPPALSPLPQSKHDWQSQGAR